MRSKGGLNKKLFSLEVKRLIQIANVGQGKLFLCPSFFSIKTPWGLGNINRNPKTDKPRTGN